MRVLRSGLLEASPSGRSHSPGIARNMDNIVNHTFGNRFQLKELRVAHRDLDASIAELSAIPHVDQLRIRRLKKEKLRLKDMIVRLESGIGPKRDS